MAKKWAVIIGIVFVLVGLLGYIPNGLVGATGYFVTDWIHNLVHILIGVILLIAAGAGERASSLWLKIFGVVYLILFIDGLIQPTNLLGFVSANDHDTWLHLFLGIVVLIAGFSSKPSAMNSMMMDKTTM